MDSEKSPGVDEETGPRIYSPVDLQSFRLPLPSDGEADAKIFDEDEEKGPHVYGLPQLESWRLTKRIEAKPVSLTTRALVFFNVYKRYFTFIVVLNAIGIGLAASDVWVFGKEKGLHVATFNIFIAVLARSELVLRGFYWLVVQIFRPNWWPLSVRTGVTSCVQQIGGVHSGCAVAGTGWLLFQLILVYLDPGQNAAVRSTATITLIALSVVCLGAIPQFRHKYHNIFEGAHRFAGWTAVVSLWVFIAVSGYFESNDTAKGGNNWVAPVYINATFWLTILITLLILAAWSTVRKVPISCHLQPSGKVALLEFQGGVEHGLLGRVARQGLADWHGFGIVSEGGSGKDSRHYMVAGVQGDWTKGLVSHPPSKLFTRQLKFAGLPYLSRLYKRGIAVCTGSGIGATLSTCLQDEGWYLIWVDGNMRERYGPTLFEMIERRIPPHRRILYDTKEIGGRPDMMAMIEDVWHTWRAEAIIVTSNPVGNAAIVQGCKERGMFCAGPIWDS